jgi:hypothetical protein
MKNSERGLVQVILVLVLVVGLAGGLFLVSQKTNVFAPKASEPKATALPKLTPLSKPTSSHESGPSGQINSKTDLEVTTQELDSTDVDAMNSDLSQLDTDSSGF